MTTIFVYEYVTVLSTRNKLPSSLVCEGRAMLDAVVADFQSVARVRTLERGDEAEFRRLAAECDFTLVIAPEFDAILETRCRWVEEAGGRLLGPGSTAVRLTADKLALFHHFHTHDIPTPLTWPIEQAPLTYPIVWKPRDGAGSQSTFLLKSASDRVAAQRALDEEMTGSPMLAQEFVEGLAVSVAWVIGPRQRLAMAPCSQRLSSDGRFHYLGGTTPISPPLAERAVGLAKRAIDVLPELRGYVGVDLVLGPDETSDRVIEINPRLTTSYVGLRRLAECNLAEVMLRLVRGQPAPMLHWHPGSVHFTPDF